MVFDMVSKTSYLISYVVSKVFDLKMQPEASRTKQFSITTGKDIMSGHQGNLYGL